MKGEAKAMPDKMISKVSAWLGSGGMFRLSIVRIGFAKSLILPPLVLYSDALVVRW